MDDPLALSPREDRDENKTFLELEPAIDSKKSIVMIGGQIPTLAPVEIEVIDEASVNQMNLDMDEFVVAEAIKINKIPEQAHVSSIEYIGRSVNDTEDQVLSLEEKNLMFKQFQFLNGEMSFSDFTAQNIIVRTDQDMSVVEEEVETRNLFENTSVIDTNQEIEVEKEEKVFPIRAKRLKKSLSPALKGLMGEANLRLARGEVELATQICMEIIRQAPNAPEPFRCLANIFENQPEKSLQYSLIAAHLSPRDFDQWMHLAELSKQYGNLTQALTCYSKAIQANPKNIEVYEIKAKLQEEEFGDKKAYLRAYSRIVHHLGPEEGPNIVKYAKLLAKHCVQENSLQIALDGMNNIIKKCPHLVTLEEVNIITELLIALKQFKKCLDILTSFTCISIEYSNLDAVESEGSADKPLQIIQCLIPDDLAVDLKAKCLISLIELDQTSVVDKLIPNFMSVENPEQSGDLFLDVAESFMNKKNFVKALEFLDPLINSQNYSLAAVWLRRAECWVGCNDLDKAIESYDKVRNLSPQHLGARMELAKLYKLKNQFNKAIEVLKQDPETEILDPGVVYERTKLLLKKGRYNEYFESGMLLLSRHCINIRSKLELIALSRTSGFKARVDILQRDRLSRGESLQDENQYCFSNNNEPSEKEEFSMFLQMCRIACKLKKYGLFQRMSFTALTSKRFANENSHIMYLCLIACIRNNDTFYGFNVVREFVRLRKNTKTWNLLNIIIQKAEDSRHNRFMMRQLGKVDVFSYLHILHANNCLVSGTYKYALNDYISLFKVKPNPLLALLVAVTLLQMACQKFSKKNQLVAQAIAFLKKYVKLRGEQGAQEANYNMARALHQLGLLPGAIHFYKLVLESKRPELVENNMNLLDLKKEAAFNLHLIYMQADNPQLARMYIENYITI